MAPRQIIIILWGFKLLKIYLQGCTRKSQIMVFSISNGAPFLREREGERQREREVY